MLLSNKDFIPVQSQLLIISCLSEVCAGRHHNANSEIVEICEEIFKTGGEEAILVQRLELFLEKAERLAEKGTSYRDAEIAFAVRVVEWLWEALQKEELERSECAF